MTKTVDIPDGTATFRDDEALNNRQTKSLQRSLRKAMAIAGKLIADGWDASDPATWADRLADIDGAEDAFEDYQHQAVLTKLVSWSYDRPLPATAENLLDEDPPVYQALVLAATGSEPGEPPATAEVIERPDFSMDAVLDPKADTDSLDLSD